MDELFFILSGTGEYRIDDGLIMRRVGLMWLVLGTALLLCGVMILIPGPL